MTAAISRLLIFLGFTLAVLGTTFAQTVFAATTIEQFCQQAITASPMAAAGARAIMGHIRGADPRERQIQSPDAPFDVPACIRHLQAVGELSSRKHGYLYLRATTPMSLEVLQLFPRATYLQLACLSRELDLQPISALYSIETVLLRECPMRHLDFVKSLPKLLRLSADTRQQAAAISLEALGERSQLLVVRFSGYSFASIAPLSRLIGLQTLHLKQSNIDSIVPLMSLTNLRSLSLEGNRQLADISAVAYMSNLDELLVGSAAIQDISMVEGLPWLRSLDLSYNQIQSLEPIRGLPNLFLLTAPGNRITDVTPIGRIPPIEAVVLDENPITDARAINELAEKDMLPPLSLSLDWSQELEMNLSPKAKERVQLQKPSPR